MFLYTLYYYIYPIQTICIHAPLHTLFTHLPTLIYNTWYVLTCEQISSTGQGSTGAVAVTEVCLAHVLSNTYSQFRSPEEWQYVLNSQVKMDLTVCLYCNLVLYCMYCTIMMYNNIVVLSCVGYETICLFL